MKFEALNQQQAELSLTTAGFEKAHTEMKEILFAVRGRMDREKAANENRLAELQETIRSGSDTARRMAALEAERLDSAAYAPTDDEIELFTEAVNTARTTVADLRAAIAHFSESCKAAQADIESKRREAVRLDPALKESWIDSIEADFRKLMEAQ